MRNIISNSPNIVEFKSEIEGSLEEFLETRQIEKLVKISRESFSSDSGATSKHSPFVEAVVNFICLDMDLLEVQCTDHTFQDSVDNLVFVLL